MNYYWSALSIWKKYAWCIYNKGLITKSVISNVSLLNLKCNILLKLKKCKIVLNVLLIKKKILKHISHYLKKKKLKICTYMYMLHGDLHIYLLISKPLMELSSIYTCSTDTWSSWHDISNIILVQLHGTEKLPCIL